jgi:hypothetical protein
MPDRIAFLRNLLGGRGDRRPPARPLAKTHSSARISSLPTAVRPRVLVVVYALRLPSGAGGDGGAGRGLVELCGFNDPRALTESFIADLAEVSAGYLRYEIAETLVLDALPPKRDGFCYDAASYLRCWQAGGGWHEPDLVDYRVVLDQLRVVRRIESGELDEIWLWGPPYAGFWESTMAGPDAYFCNSDPVDLSSCARRFIVMGFNYERGVGEMLESFGHRAESLLSRAFGGWQQRGDPTNHAWDRFSSYDLLAPGQSGCGNLHFAPNSERDYDWGNPRPVWSACNGWPNFPDGPWERRKVDCREWGNGDIRAHHKWWLAHLPRRPGETDGIRNNWWSYLVTPPD